MSEVVIHPVSKAAASRSHLNPQRFEELYRQSIESPEEFWAEQAGELIYWHEPWKTVIDSDFTKAEAKWFSGARLNGQHLCNLFYTIVEANSNYYGLLPGLRN